MRGLPGDVVTVSGRTVSVNGVVVGTAKAQAFDRRPLEPIAPTVIPPVEHIDLLNDFQLQIEHALDLENRELVLFIDASVKSDIAFQFSQLQPIRDLSHTTHAMSPSAILDVYQTMNKQMPPPCFLLAIGAESFELGDSLSQKAQRNFENACCFIKTLLNCTQIDFWQKQINVA